MNWRCSVCATPADRLASGRQFVHCRENVLLVSLRKRNRLGLNAGFSPLDGTRRRAASMLFPQCPLHMFAHQR
jgi:hypothetical protein